MRVLTVTNMYPSRDREGWGTFVHDQVESLRDLGVETDVLKIDGYRSQLEYLRAVPRLRRAIRAKQYDLIHAHYGLSGLVARCQFRLPVVVSYCGDDLYGHANARGRARLASLPLAFLQRMLSLVVDAAVVKSERMRRLLPGGKASVIPNGVDLKLFKPLDRAECRRELGLDPDAVYVLFPYERDRARKNYAAVASAVEQLDRRRRPGEAPVRILEVAGEPHARLPLYMNAADVFVLASFWEGSRTRSRRRSPAICGSSPPMSVMSGSVSKGWAARICSQDASAIADAIEGVLSGDAVPDCRHSVVPIALDRIAERLLDVYRSVLERRRPRVLMIVENLPVPFDRRVWQEARTLRDAGWRVAIISPRRGRFTSPREVVEGIEILRHPLPEARGSMGYLVEYGVALFWQTWLAWWTYVRSGFEVIHACNPPDLIFLVASPFRLLGVRFVFDHHDLCPELGEAKLEKSALTPLYDRILRLAERATFRLAEVSIATNQSFADIAVTRGGMHPNDVFVVRSAPDARLWSPVPEDPAVREGRRFVVGYVGVMGAQEGLSEFLSVVEDIFSRRGRRDVLFLLVGDGSELPRLRAEATRRGIDAAVRFTGRVPDEDLVRLLSSCDLCVNPDPTTRLNDLSSMNKIVEYMALGKAIVQFDLREGRVTAQEASSYVPPGDLAAFADAIVTLLDYTGRRLAMGAASRRRFLEDLAWEHQAPALRRCYARLAPTGTAGRRADFSGASGPRNASLRATGFLRHAAVGAPAMSKIVMFGLGYVGTTTAACQLKQGHTVVGIDISPEKVAAVGSGRSPVREPYVDELLAEGYSAGRLAADTCAMPHVATANAAMVAVGTPSKRGGGLQVEQVREVAKQIGEAVRDRPPGLQPLQCIFRSTLPPGSMEHVISPALTEAAGRPPGILYEASFNPEFLREGTAVDDYFHPPTIVIGERFKGASLQAGGLYRELDTPVTEVTYAEAEFIKMVNNSFHALKVAFANEIGRLCLASEVDPQAVMDMLVADRKLNLSAYYLRPGGPFGGSCLPKDLRALLALARESGQRVPVLEAVLPSNDMHKDLIVRSIVASVPPQSHILQIGLTFKSSTDDLRESPLVEQAHSLIEEGYRLSIYEPDLIRATLHGANLTFIESKLPDLAERLVFDLNEIEKVDLVVLCKPLHSILPDNLRDLPLIDAARLKSQPLATPVPVGRKQIEALMRRRLLTLATAILAVFGIATAPAVGEEDDWTYRLDSGAEVRVTVFKEPDMSGDFRVDMDGTMSIPGVGDSRTGTDQRRTEAGDRDRDD